MYFTLYFTASCFPTAVFTSLVLITFIARKNVSQETLLEIVNLTRSVLFATKMVALPARLELDTKPASNLSA